MKATGIVRRIDDLGRVVIPKEIRRTQFIRVGDPLEIFVTDAGDVVFKKYSPVKEISDSAALWGDILHKTAGLSVVFTDRDRVVAACGTARRCIERQLSPEYCRLIEHRRSFSSFGENPPRICREDDTAAQAVIPILAGGDLVGSAALVSPEAGEHDIRLLKVAAAYLGRQLEE